MSVPHLGNNIFRINVSLTFGVRVRASHSSSLLAPVTDPTCAVARAEEEKAGPRHVGGVVLD